MKNNTLKKLHEIYKNSAIPTIITILFFLSFIWQFYTDRPLTILDRWILSIWFFLEGIVAVLNFWQKKLEREKTYYICENLKLEEKIKKFKLLELEKNEKGV